MSPTTVLTAPGVRPPTAVVDEVDVVDSSCEARRHAVRGFHPPPAERWRSEVGRLPRARIRLPGLELGCFGYRP